MSLAKYFWAWASLILLLHDSNVLLRTPACPTVSTTKISVEQKSRNSATERGDKKFSFYLYNRISFFEISFCCPLCSMHLTYLINLTLSLSLCILISTLSVAEIDFYGYLSNTPISISKKISTRFQIYQPGRASSKFQQDVQKLRILIMK